MRTQTILYQEYQSALKNSKDTEASNSGTVKELLLNKIE